MNNYNYNSLLNKQNYKKLTQFLSCFNYTFFIRLDNLSQSNLQKIKTLSQNSVSTLKLKQTIINKKLNFIKGQNSILVIGFNELNTISEIIQLIKNRPLFLIINGKIYSIKKIKEILKHPIEHLPKNLLLVLYTFLITLNDLSKNKESIIN